MIRLFFTLGILLGILLCVTGVLTILVTGLDLLWSACGTLVLAGGTALTCYCHKRNPDAPNAGARPERSSAPEASSAERNKQLKDRL